MGDTAGPVLAVVDAAEHWGRTRTTIASVCAPDTVGTTTPSNQYWGSGNRGYGSSKVLSGTGDLRCRTSHLLLVSPPADPYTRSAKASKFS
eukprot:1615625-Rhodomonas_salina.2